MQLIFDSKPTSVDISPKMSVVQVSASVTETLPNDPPVLEPEEPFENSLNAAEEIVEKTDKEKENESNISGDPNLDNELKTDEIEKIDEHATETKMNHEARNDKDEDKKATPDKEAEMNENANIAEYVKKDEESKLMKEAVIQEKSKIQEESKIEEDTLIGKETAIGDEAKIEEEFTIENKTNIDEEVGINKNNKIEEENKIEEDVKIEVAAKVHQEDKIDEDVHIDEEDKVQEEDKINEDVKIDEEAKVQEEDKINKDVREDEEAMVEEEDMIKEKSMVHVESKTCEESSIHKISTKDKNICVDGEKKTSNQISTDKDTNIDDTNIETEPIAENAMDEISNTNYSEKATGKNNAIKDVPEGNAENGEKHTDMLQGDDLNEIDDSMCEDDLLKEDEPAKSNDESLTKNDSEKQFKKANANLNSTGSVEMEKDCQPESGELAKSNDGSIINGIAKEDEKDNKSDTSASVDDIEMTPDKNTSAEFSKQSVEDFIKATDVIKTDSIDTNEIGEDSLITASANVSVEHTNSTETASNSIKENVMDIDNDKSDKSQHNINILPNSYKADKDVKDKENGEKTQNTETAKKRTRNTANDIICSNDKGTPAPVVINAVDDKTMDEAPVSDTFKEGKECVTLVDDDEDNDDIMVIDEDVSSKTDNTADTPPEKTSEQAEQSMTADKSSSDNDDDLVISIDANETESPATKESSIKDEAESKENTINETDTKQKKNGDMPLVALNFLNSFKSKMGDMTRVDLEEFCLVKIVEGVVDRSNLSEIKGKLKTMMQNVEEWRKKAMVLNKQNRDLQIVLRTVQEEQKKKSDEVITPLKITRSVGMQVLMTESKADNFNRARGPKRHLPNSNANNQLPKNIPIKPNTQQIKSLKSPIPVPRLVPALNSSPSKPGAPRASPQLQNSTVTSNSGTGKATTPNGVRTYTPVKSAEKRSYSVSIDLTDDEPPPAKQMAAGKGTQPPVRLVPSQQLMAPGNRASLLTHTKNSNPRQVYIPIGGPQGNIRPGQTIVFKNSTNVRQRQPNPGTIVRTAGPGVRASMNRSQNKHPAPLPQAYSQPQPPNWKALPPAPDLKISKIENGIVVSWKIEGYHEDSFEEIVSYQLYAYQETSAPASTFLWNKIGDIKALPLPMACTLTQFIAGYKYYFAVRAVDIRSRIGPFSLPGSILLLNK